MNYKPIYSVLVIIFCTAFILFSVISHIKNIPIKDRELVTVTGTIESYGSFNRYFNIQINEDNLDYNVVTIYRKAFSHTEFQRNVQVGDQIHMICSDYMGDTMFDNSNITKASIYSIKVNDTYYMSIEDSMSINEEKQSWSNVYPDLFIPAIVIVFQLGMVIHYFIVKKRKHNSI